MAILEGDSNLLIIDPSEAMRIEKANGLGNVFPVKATFATQFYAANVSGSIFFAMSNEGPYVVGIKNVSGCFTIDSTASAGSNINALWKKGVGVLGSSSIILPVQIGGYPRRPSSVQIRDSTSGSSILISSSTELDTIISTYMPYSVSSRRYPFEYEFYSPGDPSSYLELLPGEVLTLQSSAPATGAHGISGIIEWDEYPLQEYL